MEARACSKPVEEPTKGLVLPMLRCQRAAAALNLQSFSSLVTLIAAYRGGEAYRKPGCCLLAGRTEQQQPTRPSVLHEEQEWAVLTTQ